MFGWKRAENPPLQLYGKLPLAKDYLRLGLAEGAGLALRDWLDTTFSGPAAREHVPELAWPARFLIGEAWGGCLQGLLAPSADAGGLRPFPFVMCVERKRRALQADLEAGLVEAEGIWDQLRQRRERCAQFADGRGLLAALRGDSVAVDAVEKIPAAGVDAEAWLQALWPEAGVAGFESALERLLPLARSAEPLRLPIVSGGSQRQQILAWLEVLCRMGVTDGSTVPTLFFPEGPPSGAGVDGSDAPGAGYLVVFRRPARASDGTWLESADPGQALGEGDLVGGQPVPAPLLLPATEGLPPLGASLRNGVSGFLRRFRGER